jgi:hypothetical protein
VFAGAGAATQRTPAGHDRRPRDLEGVAPPLAIVTKLA